MLRFEYHDLAEQKVYTIDAVRVRLKDAGELLAITTYMQASCRHDLE